jgi:hypothetical protein
VPFALHLLQDQGHQDEAREAWVGALERLGSEVPDGQRAALNGQPDNDVDYTTEGVTAQDAHIAGYAHDAGRALFGGFGTAGQRCTTMRRLILDCPCSRSRNEIGASPTDRPRFQAR